MRRLAGGQVQLVLRIFSLALPTNKSLARYEHTDMVAHKALTATHTHTCRHTLTHTVRQREQNTALVSTWSQSCFVFEAPLKSTLLSMHL